MSDSVLTIPRSPGKPRKAMEDLVFASFQRHISDARTHTSTLQRRPRQRFRLVDFGSEHNFQRTSFPPRPPEVPQGTNLLFRLWFILRVQTRKQKWGTTFRASDARACALNSIPFCSCPTSFSLLFLLSTTNPSSSLYILSAHSLAATAFPPVFQLSGTDKTGTLTEKRAFFPF